MNSIFIIAKIIFLINRNRGFPRGFEESHTALSSCRSIKTEMITDIITGINSKMRPGLATTLLFAISTSQTKAFTVITPSTRSLLPQSCRPKFHPSPALFQTYSNDDNDDDLSKHRTTKELQKVFTTFAIASTLTFSTIASSPLPSYANDDYAADTVTTMIQSIKNSAGKKQETLAVFEDLAAVITEGKGIGGDVSYGEPFTYLHIYFHNFS